MSARGETDLLLASRAALLDALEALAPHLDAVVVIGAHAVYMHTEAAPLALAETTKDSDLAIDSRALGDDPLLDDVMTAAGFRRDLESPQPGSWLSPRNIPVDLMVPEALAGARGRRGARIPPHSRHATRRATGLEAAVIDHAPVVVRAFEPHDDRAITVNVAGPAALIVAKLHKLGDRRSTPGRLLDKDAHDLYRLLVAVPTEELAAGLQRLRADELAGPVTTQALALLVELFRPGPDAPGAMMAGRAEEGIGNPQVAAASAAFLSGDLLDAAELGIELPPRRERR